VEDCVEGEDEVGCSPAPPCPGYYRCHGSPVCVHALQVGLQNDEIKEDDDNNNMFDNNNNFSFIIPHWGNS
jgi:hypothetical protein